MKNNIITLKEICKITTGSKDVNEGHSDGIYPFFTCAAIPLKSNSYSFDDEVILLPGNGANVGMVMYFKGKFEAYQRTYVLHSFKGFLPRFVFYYLNSYWKQMNLYSQYGSATNYIRYDNIANFNIPLLELSKQQKLVSLLDKADAIRKKRQETIKLADEFLRSTFLEMFGDPFVNPKGWTKNELKNYFDIIFISFDKLYFSAVFKDQQTVFGSIKIFFYGFPVCI